MKKIVSQSGTYGTYGPYATVDVLADRYRVNGAADLPFSVIDPQGSGTTVEDWVGPLPSPPPSPLPPEIPMHKVRKALKQLGPNGAIVPETYADSWWMRTLAVIDSLSNPIQRDSIMDELNTAPNMVLAGASTQMIAAAIGMSSEELEAVARLALTLP